MNCLGSANSTESDGNRFLLRLGDPWKEYDPICGLDKLDKVNGAGKWAYPSEFDDPGSNYGLP